MVSGGHLHKRGRRSHARFRQQPIEQQQQQQRVNGVGQDERGGALGSLGYPHGRPMPVSIVKEDDDPWSVLAETVWSRTKDDIERWWEEINSLLTFAGLFSAVVTGFAVMCYTLLASPSASTDAPVIHRYVAALWFASLVCGLASASIAIAVNQWLNYLLTPARLVEFGPRQKLRIWNLRQETFKRWQVDFLLGVPPVLLQVGMALFLSGLVGLLWTLSIAIALPTLILVALVLAFQLATLVIPAIVEYSAFQSPQAQWLRWILFHAVHGIACTIHWAASACIRASRTQLTTSNELLKPDSRSSTQVSGQGMKRDPTSAVDREVGTQPVQSNKTARPDSWASKTAPFRLEALDRFVHRLGELCKHCSWVMNEKHYLDEATNSEEIDSKLFAATFATAVTKDDQPTLGYIQRCLHDMPLDLACSNAAALWVACDNARLDNAMREAHESDNNSQNPADSPAEPSQARRLVSKPIESYSQPPDCTSKPTAASSQATDRPLKPTDSASKPSVHFSEPSAASYQAADLTPKPVDGIPAPMDGAKKPVGLSSQPSGDDSVPKDTDCSPPPAAYGKNPAVNISIMMPPYSEPDVGWHYDSLDRDVTNMMAEVLVDVITRLVHIEPKDLPKSMRPVEKGVVADKIIDMCGKLNNLLLLLPSMGDGFAYHHLLKLVHISRNAKLVTLEARKSILDLLWSHADHHFDLQDIAEIKETINASHGMEVDYNMKLELIMLALHIHVLRKDNANDVLTDLDEFLKSSSRSQFKRGRATERSHVDILFSDLAIYINTSDHQSDVGFLNRVVCRLIWLVPEDNGFRFHDPSTSAMRDTSLTEVLTTLKSNGEGGSAEPLACAEDDSGGDEEPAEEIVNESRPGQSNLEPADAPLQHIKHCIEQLPCTMPTWRRRRRGPNDIV